MGRTRSFDETEVLERLQKQFRTTGYSATSLDDVMQATGLGKGSLYGAFGDKRAMFDRVFDRYCADVVAAVDAALAGPDDTAFVRLEALIIRAARTPHTESAPMACFLAKTTAEMAAVDAGLAEKSRSTFDKLELSYTACLEQAQRAGDVTREIPASALGRTVLALTRGMEALAEAGVDKSVLVDTATTGVRMLRSL